MRVETLLYFYGRRLRTHPVQELLAGCGIAIGVALAFAVMVANGSIAGSADEIVRAVTGRADLQLVARDAHGFEAELLDEVRGLPGVERAAPLLEQRAVMVGPDGRRASIELASVDASLAALSGRLAGNFAAGGLELVRGVLLPTATAGALGIPDPASQQLPSPSHITLELGGERMRLPISAVLGRETIGPVAQALIAIVPLRRLQELTGMEGRISRVLVETQPGQLALARDGIERVARRHHLSLGSAQEETALLRQALGPSDQATGFFAAISALLGFLLAFNAMLLTAPERRRMIGELRLQGFRARQLVALLLFQALVLGAVASVGGLLAGHALSRGIFQQSPDYLAPAFTLGTGTVVGVGPVLLALGGGIVACVLAAAPPLLDVRRRRSPDAIGQATGVAGNALGASTRRRLLVLALGLIAVATALPLLLAEATLVACAVLAIGTVCLIPTAFAAVVRAGEALAARLQWVSTLTLALLALRATTLRGLALAATGAVAVFGSVAIGGAREDLLGGIDRYAREYVGTADLWIVNPLDDQATKPIPDDLVPAVTGAEGVGAVRAYRGGFLDLDGRRVWMIARSSRDAEMLPGSQLIEGDLAEATARLRAGGWAVASDQVARAQGAEVGDTLRLPTPTGVHELRLAATTTNLGWPPGAVILNGDDYRRAWNADAPTALEVDVAPEADPLAARAAIEAALGPDRALEVQTAAQRRAGINDSARQGLNRLGHISLLLLVAAVLAMGAAMGATLWQRRASLAALRIQSFTPRQLWRVMLLESGFVLSAGCVTGAVAGVYGQLGIDRYLRLVTGFPVAVTPGSWQLVETCALVIGAALVAVAIPGWFAARVAPRLGLQE